MMKKIWLYVQYFAALVILGVFSMFVLVTDTYWYLTNSKPYWAKPKGAGAFFREGKEYMDHQMDFYLKRESQEDG